MKGEGRDGEIGPIEGQKIPTSDDGRIVNLKKFKDGRE